MEHAQLLAVILDNLVEEVVFVDMGHVIRYMNAAAKRHYARYGDIVGNSIFACHGQASAQKIRDILAQLETGAQEILYSENAQRRIFMSAIRESSGRLIGYRERYESPPSTRPVPSAEMSGLAGVREDAG